MAMSYTRKKSRKQFTQAVHASLGAVVFSKRRAKSPRKLEPHEVIERLKARRAVHG